MPPLRSRECRATARTIPVRSAAIWGPVPGPGLRGVGSPCHASFAGETPAVSGGAGNRIHSRHGRGRRTIEFCPYTVGAATLRANAGWTSYYGGGELAGEPQFLFWRCPVAVQDAMHQRCEGGHRLARIVGIEGYL